MYISIQRDFLFLHLSVIYENLIDSISKLYNFMDRVARDNRNRREPKIKCSNKRIDE